MSPHSKNGENNRLHGRRRAKALAADWPALMRTFLQPDSPHARATLLKYMEQALFGLQDFLQAHLGITQNASLQTLAAQYGSARISALPEKTLSAVISELIEAVAPHAVNVSSPYFVGHMTSALPFFMVHLKTLVAALNQNVVKLETSKVVSILEKQVLAQMHHLVFGRSPTFYRRHVQNPDTALGSITEDGTIANLTALWVARNRCLPDRPALVGVERCGLAAAMTARGIERCVVLASALGHHSLHKAAGILGIGNDNVLPVPVDRHGALQIGHLATMLERLQSDRKTAVLAVVGVAGTTETGSIDPLDQMATVCRDKGIHFHKDSDFELTSPPQLNILTYRFCPAPLRRARSRARGAAREALDQWLDALNIGLQRQQREAGRSFVSRTTLPAGMCSAAGRVVLRCVTMNPLTDLAILQEILAEQRTIGQALMAEATRLGANRQSASPCIPSNQPCRKEPHES